MRISLFVLLVFASPLFAQTGILERLDKLETKVSSELADMRVAIDRLGQKVDQLASPVSDTRSAATVNTWSAPQQVGWSQSYSAPVMMNYGNVRAVRQPVRTLFRRAAGGCASGG